MVGVDRDPDLVAALAERAGELPVETRVADARDFELGVGVGLALAPMQLIQLLGGREERLECLRRVAAHLAPGGRAALALVECLPEPGNGPLPLPDVREQRDWVYSSLPLETVEDGEEIAIRRLRQTVSPAGELSEEENEVRLWRLDAARLEVEAAAIGFETLIRREIAATDLHVGSTVVLLRRAA